MTRANVVVLTTVVDLMGRLSNPSEHLKHLVDRGSGESGHGPKRRSRGSGAVAAAADPASSEERDGFQTPLPDEFKVGFADPRST